MGLDEGRAGIKDTVWPDVKTKVEVATDSSIDVTGPGKFIVELGGFARISHHLPVVY